MDAATSCSTRAEVIPEEDAVVDGLFASSAAGVHSGGPDAEGTAALETVVAAPRTSDAVHRGLFGAEQSCCRSPEVEAAERDRCSALHPVSPPVVTFSFCEHQERPHGPFTLAEVRLLCRSGIRTRGYHVGAFVDDPDMARSGDGMGFPCAVADVTMSRRYDGATGRSRRRVCPLAAGHTAPRALSPSDLQYTSTMNPARLDRGLRLLQVEREFQFAERRTRRTLPGHVRRRCLG